MPKINLKPNSAEFAEENEAPAERVCDMPGCRLHGDYKAPKDRELDEYYWFCLEHVQEYNKAWNFFQGMSSIELEEHIRRSHLWDRPTWKFDASGFEDSLRNKAWQSYHFTERDRPDDEQEQRQSYNFINKDTPEYEAMAIMGLEPPLDLQVIKSKYKALVKKHHPDLNGGDAKSEELLKSINMAYTILKLAYEKYEFLQNPADTK